MEYANCIIKNSICIFDSGVGGLNVLKECVTKLPSYNYTYVADNYNVPYGNKSPRQLMSLILPKFDAIAENRPQAVIIGCNTVTTNCISELRRIYPFPIIGMQPAIKQGCIGGRKCLLLCTMATAESENLRSLIKESDACRLYVYPVDGFADYIENNVFCLNEKVIENFLPYGKFDSVVLGCTHYIFATKIIKKLFNCDVYDGLSGTANHLSNILGEVDHQCDKKPKITFYSGNFIKNKALFDKINAY